MRKKWFIEADEPEQLNPDLDPLLQTILGKRGIGPGDMSGFLFNTIDDLFDPFLMRDMITAVDRIITAQKNKERIIIYGDYDVDGITATTLLYQYLESVLDLDVGYYLPNRAEGYGLNMNAIKVIAKDGANLILTVDCGITAIKEIKYANSLGIDVVITDHHQPGSILPEAKAVINPHREDDNYPFKYLAGVGVAFKLCQAIEKKIHGKTLSDELSQMLDIVALGTVADIVPLLGENRIIVKTGLKRMADSNNPGLITLIKEVGLEDKEINAGRIGFIIAPPLNAAGRMQDPATGIDLLTADSVLKARPLARELIRVNRERQQLEEKIFQEAVELVETQIDFKQERAIILDSSQWHHGVIGIVASRLVEKYYRPTILIASEGDINKGSCRSIRNLNIHQALTACSDYLKGFGGHAMAAGIEIDTKNINAFRKCFNQYLITHLDKNDLIPQLTLDATLKASEINIGLYEKLEQLKPFGMGNSRPTFLLNNALLKQSYKVGKNKTHLNFTLESGLKGIGFGFADYQEELKKHKLNLAFSIHLNEWRGRREIQLRLEDFNLRGDEWSYPVNFNLNNWLIADKRECSNSLQYLKGLAGQKQKLAVYLNNLKLCQYLKNGFFQNTNVYLANDKRELIKFEDETNGILLFTNANIDLKIEIENLVFLSLPFSLTEMVKLVNTFKYKDILIYLLYGKEQLETNQNIIKQRLPDEKYLRRLYLYLKAFPDENLLLTDLQQSLSGNKGFSYNQSLVENSLGIFTELGLVKQREEMVILSPVNGEKLDLSNSIRYNDTIEISNHLMSFAKLAFADDLFPLIKALQNRTGGSFNGFV